MKTKRLYRHAFRLIVETEYDLETTEAQIDSLLENWCGAGDVHWKKRHDGSVGVSVNEGGDT